MKKVTALLLALAMATSLVACGNTADSGAAATAEPAATEEAAAEEAAPADEAPAAEASGEKTDITMWCIAVESDSNRHAYEAALADFEAAHPEINFTWEATQNQDYKTKIKAAMAADELPDIFFTWGGGFIKEFVDAGRVYALDDAYAEYADALPKNSLVNHSFDGKIYATPTNYNVVCMYANMDLLKQAGYDKVPATYDELIDCCDKLVAKGIIPFGCSGKETWCVTEYLESIIEKSVGAQQLSDMYNGTTPWNNEGVIEAVGIFQEMIDKEYFDPEGIALSDNEIKENYKADKYAFYINGSWNCADFVNAGMADKVQVAEFPVINEANSKLGQLIGGPSDALAVSASSPNAELAAKCALEISQSVCKYGYLDGNGLPAWTPDYDVSSLNSLTLSVADIVANATDAPVLFGDTFLNADNANIYLDYVSQIYASAIDGKTFVEGLDADLKH